MKIGQTSEHRLAWEAPDGSEGREVPLRGCLAVPPSEIPAVSVLEERVVTATLELKVVQGFGTFHQLRFLLAQRLWVSLLYPVSRTVRRNGAGRKFRFHIFIVISHGRLT